jgi:CheY-like chemotaxis protein
MSNFPYKKVVIIDDSKIDHFVSNAMIRKSSFAEEVVNFNAAEAALVYLGSFAHNPDGFPEIILLDINMPAMDGFDFLDEYTKLPDTLQSRCSVIMISSSNSDEDFNRIKAYPSVCMFFNKPLTHVVLNNIHKNLEVKVLC